MSTIKYEDSPVLAFLKPRITTESNPIYTPFIHEGKKYLGTFSNGYFAIDVFNDAPQGRELYSKNDWPKPSVAFGFSRDGVGHFVTYTIPTLLLYKFTGTKVALLKSINYGTDLTSMGLALIDDDPYIFGYKSNSGLFSYTNFEGRTWGQGFQLEQGLSHLLSYFVDKTNYYLFGYKNGKAFTYKGPTTPPLLVPAPQGGPIDWVPGFTNFQVFYISSIPHLAAYSSGTGTVGIYTLTKTGPTPISNIPTQSWRPEYTRFFLWDGLDIGSDGAKFVD